MFKVRNKDAGTTCLCGVCIVHFKHGHFLSSVSYLLWKCKCLVGNVSLNSKIELESLRKTTVSKSRVHLFWEKSMLQVEGALKAASILDPVINKCVNTYLLTKCQVSNIS